MFYCVPKINISEKNYILFIDFVMRYILGIIRFDYATIHDIIFNESMHGISFVLYVVSQLALVDSIYIVNSFGEDIYAVDVSMWKS